VPGHGKKHEWESDKRLPSPYNKIFVCISSVISNPEVRGVRNLFQIQKRLKISPRFARRNDSSYLFLNHANLAKKPLSTFVPKERRLLDPFSLSRDYTRDYNSKEDAMGSKQKYAEQIFDNVWRIGFGFVSMYAFKSGEDAVLIDTGFGSRAMRKGLEECGIMPGEIKAIFLTHTDMDHTGGIRALPQARLYISKDEEQMINGRTARFFGFIRNSLPVKSYTLCKDDEVIRVGGIEVRCLFTPGHTPGSMSYLVNGKYLFVGDILNIKGGEVVMDRGFIMMDTQKQRESIIRISQLSGLSLIAPAHSDYSKDPERALSRWKGRT
jgi:hydroxyacylglutathione hydrolase